MKILVGADPELFVTKAGALVSGFDMIPGTKREPFKVNKGAVQVDGMALEFNIDPAADENEFVVNINTVLAEMAKMIPGYDLNAIPVAHFGKAFIDAQPYAAKELGCDPDFNAWNNGKANPRPDVDTPFRTASGHVHIGFTEGQSINDPQHKQGCIELVKQLDYYLGLPSLFWDKDEERRQLYGKAGCYRPKSYGVEYRVLSNAWLKSESLLRFVFRATNQAVQDLIAGKNLSKEFGDQAEQAINTGNRTLARDILSKAGLEVPNAA